MPSVTIPPRTSSRPSSLMWGVILSCAGAAPAWPLHAVAQFGEPKYPADFTHFDYADPGAPKGGSLTLSMVSMNSSYDKLNPFSFKGIAAPGLLDLVFETLTTESMDEINTQYGLVADDIRLAADFSSANFHINPRARFSNGDPVTAKDVQYSFNTLTGRKASPRFKAYFAEITGVTLLDRQTVRFDFARAGRDLSFVAGSLPIFSPKWGLQADGSSIAFDKLRFENPIGSGPYTVEKAANGQGVAYRRNPDYWAGDLPVRRGMYNFGRVTYKIYKDIDTQVAALRAGDFDVTSDSKMRYWCCQYIGKRFDDGDLIKEVIPNRGPPAFNGWILNLRRTRFQDRRVREALDDALDFEWMNQKIFIGEFERTQSYFPNTPLAATGLPSAAELKLLEPYRDQLDPEVFGPMVAQPSTRPPSSLRHNLTHALRLLAEAGWHNQDGVLRNDKGEPFVIEISSASREQNPYMDPIYLNLSKLGIIVKKKLQDAAASRQRMARFDYDYASISLPETRMPGAMLWRYFNSGDAEVPGSDNVGGLQSTVVDALLRNVLSANSEAELETAAHALDRVLMHGYYIIPWRYLTHSYMIHSKRLQRPRVLPDYYDPYGWVQATWWDSGAAAMTASR